MKKFKVGMVGVGRATAYGHIFENRPDTEVVALCDMNQESLEKNGADFGLGFRQPFHHVRACYRRQY